MGFLLGAGALPLEVQGTGLSQAWCFWFPIEALLEDDSPVVGEMYALLRAAVTLAGCRLWPTCSHYLACLQHLHHVSRSALREMYRFLHLFVDSTTQALLSGQ